MMNNRWLRKLIGGISFTSALFIFQACYGTPQDFGMDILLEGQVKSKTTGLPIKGIKVSVHNNYQYDVTDEQGKFSFYTEKYEELIVKFNDSDPDLDGHFSHQDTILTDVDDKVFLEITLEEAK